MPSNFRTGGNDARWSATSGSTTVNCSTSGYNFIRFLQTTIGVSSRDGIWGSDTTERLAIVLDAASQPQTDDHRPSPRGTALAAIVRQQGQARAIGEAMLRAAIWYLLWYTQNADIDPNQIQFPGGVTLPIWNVRPALPPANARAIAAPNCAGDLSALTNTPAPVTPSPPADTSTPVDTSTTTDTTLTQDTSTPDTSNTSFTDLLNNFGMGGATGGGSSWAISPIGAPTAPTPLRPTGVPTTFFLVTGAVVLGLGALGYLLMRGPTLSASGRVTHARPRRGRKSR